LPDRGRIPQSPRAGTAKEELEDLLRDMVQGDGVSPGRGVGVRRVLRARR
jgi:hypothetical protein